MTDQPSSHPHLEQAVSAAQTEIQQHHQKTQEQESSRSVAAWRKTALPRYVLLGMLVVLCGVAYVQYPRIIEPYGVPDPEESSAVATADLEAIATFVEMFRISQGRYPDSLDQINLPEGVADLIKQSNLHYRKTDNAFMLNWTLPRWRLEYDGQTQATKVDLSVNR